MSDLRSDADVMQASLGNPSDFELIFDRYHRRVFSFLASRVGRDAAGDLAADVFVIAFRDRSRFDPSADSAIPWLLGIANNLARRHARTKARRERAYRRSVGETGGVWISADVEARVDAERQVAALREAVAKLRDRDRETLLLYALSDLTYAEVADALGIPVGTVRSRIARARKRIVNSSAVRGQLPSGNRREVDGP